MDYYNYINNLNQMADQNQMMFEQNKVSKSKQNNQSKNTINGLAEPYIGFTRGNMFDNLYDEYKNYRPQELNPKDDKEYLMLLMQMYGFAAHDLGLYLDVNPNDTNVIRQRSEYIRMYKEALMQYENSFGPITKESIMLENNWSWNTTKWPWEGNK
jgi:spore coat protein JB